MPFHWFLFMLGLLLAGFAPAGTATNDEYDWHNRLVKRGTGITILYDAEGNRVSKTANGVTTHYLVDDQNPTGYAQVLAEYEVQLPSATGLTGYWALNEATGTSAADGSGNSRHGTLVNGPVWNSGEFNGAVLLDGVNDHVNVPHQLITTSDTKYSYTAWFCWNGSGGGADGRKFILETTGSGNPHLLSAAVTSAAKIQVYTSLSGGEYNVTGTTTITALVQR